MITTSNIKEKIKKFYSALSLAFYDRKLELGGYNFLLFCDTDVVLRMILGFYQRWHSSPAAPKPTAEQDLVRALLSCKFLGEIHMLRPHAFELEVQLGNQPKFQSQAQKNILEQRAEEYLQDKGIHEKMSRLCEIASKNDLANQEKLFIQELSQNAAETFSAIERINGTWLRRFSILLDNQILGFENLGPEMSTLFSLYGDTVHTINKILTKKSPKQKRSSATFKDAAALGIIYSMIDQQKKTIVRFYTESASFFESLKDNELRKFISYPRLSNIDIPPGADIVFRDVHYLIMRAWFSELAPGREGTSLDEIEQLLGQIYELLVFEERNLLKGVRRIDYKKKSLQQLINEFEQLTILESIWVRGRIPKFVTQNFKEWVAVFDFAQNKKVSDVLFQQIDDLRQELSRKVSLAGTWIRDYEMVVKASEKAQEKISANLEDPMRDLGLVRWGYVLNHKNKSRLIEIVKTLIEEQGDELLKAANTVANLMEDARHDPEECMLVCAILWSLFRYQEISSLINFHRSRSKKPLNPSLQVMEAAAILKNGLVPKQNVEAIVIKMWSLKNSLSKDKLAGILLGVGYVFYHAWKIHTRGDNTADSSELTSEVNELAERSFLVGEEASALLPKDTLAWAFSINHCAYVGIITGVFPKKTDYYFQILLRLESWEAFWNHRFNDTGGAYYLLQAERKWSKLSKEDSLGLVNKARDYFNKAKGHDFGDIDLEEHIKRLDFIENKIKE